MNRAVAATTMALSLLLFGISPPASAASHPSPELTAPGPELLTPPEDLDAALSCSSDLATADKTPILLVPGTITTPRQAWSWGYQRVLRAQGYPVCTVALPNEGTGDMQVAVEYVVSAAREMHETSGRKISMIGHSQGGLLIGWALQFWPDLSSKVDDGIALDSPFKGGVEIAEVCGVAQTCPSLVWQIRKGSIWAKAMTRSPLETEASVTSISAGEGTDLIPPNSTPLDGATNASIQDLCAGRKSGHVQMLADAAAHALTMDALTHSGPADVERTATSACEQRDFGGIDQSGKQTTLLLLDDVLRELFQAKFVPEEPPLRDYALGRAGDVNLSQNKDATASSTQACCGSFAASNVVDGDLNSRWASAYGADPSWVSVDLGETRTVSGIQLDWERAYARNYDIQVRTGSSWRTVHSTTAGNGHNDVIQLDDVDARHVRMVANKRGSLFGYSLWEMTIVGH